MAGSEFVEWSQFGLAGVVIAALFGSLYTIVRWLIGHIDKQAAEHRSERNDWKRSSEETSGRLEMAIRELAESFRQNK